MNRVINEPWHRNTTAALKLDKIINNDDLLKDNYEDCIVVIVWNQPVDEDFNFAAFLDQLS